VIVMTVDEQERHKDLVDGAHRKGSKKDNVHGVL
jgi:hypothetical protein